MILVGPLQLRMFCDSVKMILKVSFSVSDSVYKNINLMQGKRGFLQLHDLKLTTFLPLFPAWSSSSCIVSMELDLFLCKDEPV